MASLDDIRAAGYTVTLAWKGWTADNRTIPDVYAISRTGPPDQTGVTRPEINYLPDDPDTLEQFLHPDQSGDLAP